MGGIDQLHNLYTKKVGALKRRAFYFEHGRVKQRNTSEEIYDLSLETLLTAAKVFYEDRTPDIAKYNTLFRELVKDGACCEGLVCAAAVYSQQEAKESKRDDEINSAPRQVMQICDEWETNIHHALQYATLEYIVRRNKTFWEQAIVKLCSMGADPNYSYASERFDFHMTINRYTFDEWTPGRKSIFTILLSCFKLSEKMKVEILNYFSQSQTKLKTNSVDQNNIDCTLNRYHSYYESSHNPSFFDSALFLYIQQSFPLEHACYIENQKSRLIESACNHCKYNDILMLYDRYGFDSTETLAKKIHPTQEDKKQLYELYTYQFLSDNFHGKFSKYLQANRHVLFEKFKASEYIDSQVFLTMNYGVDGLQLKVKPSENRYAALNSFYLFRMKTILKFIDSEEANLPIHLFSNDFTNIINLLRKAVKTPETATKSYIAIYDTLCKLKTKKPKTRLDEEHQIYCALTAERIEKEDYYFIEKNNDHPLTKFIDREFVCLDARTILMGTHPKEDKSERPSSVRSFAKSSIYEPKLFRIIFEFVDPGLVALDNPDSKLSAKEFKRA